MASPLGPWETQKLLLDAFHFDQFNIFDVGSHVGDTVARYRELFPQARIFCFEPLQQLVSRLRIRFQSDKGIFITRSAVSNEVGEASFYTGGSQHEMSSLNTRPAYGRRYYAHYLEPVGMVPTTTINAFVEHRKILNINVLKIDIHGAEHAALMGATDILKKQRVDLILVETYFVPLYANTTLFPDLCKFLEGYGYTLHSLHDLEFATWDKQLRLANALFISNMVRHNVLGKFKGEWKIKK